jgi:peptide-methionine (S)-S-oxide reductase
MNTKLQTAIFGAGCFWSQEALFKELKGVISATPGYAGGSKANPTYEEVGSGATGHAETIKIEFDPAQITYHDLLEVFFFAHDPTALNRQGNDVGAQYRSLILYTDETQKKEAEEFIAKLNNDKVFKNQIVTEIKKFEQFYPAEKYHQDYYDKNKGAPYCLLVIGPKMLKFQEKFKNLLK